MKKSIVGYAISVIGCSIIMVNYGALTAFGIILMIVGMGIVNEARS